MGIRLSMHDEELGADVVEHGLRRHTGAAMTYERLNIVLKLLEGVTQDEEDMVTLQPKLNVIRKALLLDKVTSKRCG